MKEQLLSGKIANKQDINAIAGQIKEGFNEQGNQRFFKPSEISWKKEFENLNLDNIEVEITGEAADTQSMLTTIDKALTIVANPAYSQNKQAQYLVNKALTKSGFLSPVEISSMPAPEPVQPVDTGGQMETLAVKP